MDCFSHFLQSDCILSQPCSYSKPPTFPMLTRRLRTAGLLEVHQTVQKRLCFRSQPALSLYFSGISFGNDYNLQDFSAMIWILVFLGFFFFNIVSEHYITALLRASNQMTKSMLCSPHTWDNFISGFSSFIGVCIQINQAGFRIQVFFYNINPQPEVCQNPGKPQPKTLAQFGHRVRRQSNQHSSGSLAAKHWLEDCVLATYLQTEVRRVFSRKGRATIMNKLNLAAAVLASLTRLQHI